MLAAAALAAGCAGGGEEAAAPTVTDPAATWRAAANDVCAELRANLQTAAGASAVEAQDAARQRIGALDAPPALRADVRALLAALAEVDRLLTRLRSLAAAEQEAALAELDEQSQRATRLAAELGLESCPLG